jgi:hypothetical protein
MVRAIVLSLTLLCAGFAPAPPLRQRNAQVTPGEWDVELAGTKTVLVLRSDFSFAYRWFQTTYWGSWHWDEHTRILKVMETTDGERWWEWNSRLSRDMEGEFSYKDSPQRKSSIKMRRRRGR